jgi:flagellar basal-body rod protein FlgG
MPSRLNLEVIANNIANINTTGYKRARAEFSDLLYQSERAQGVPNRANQAIVPEGAIIGLGVQTSAVRNICIRRAELTSTGNNLDMALVGRGWFQIETPDGETLYSRAGAFNTNAQGQLVTIDGYTVVPAITLPPNASEITVSTSGQVMVRVGNDTDPTEIGQLTIANFVNEAGLSRSATTCSSRRRIRRGRVGTPADPGFAQIKQGYLEASNVDRSRKSPT